MQNNIPPISSTLLECIMYDTLDDPEYLLDSLEIDHPNSDHQDEIETLADTIIDKYQDIYWDCNYYDLEAGTAECLVVLRYEGNKYYRVYYDEYVNGSIEIENIEEVEPYQETVTKYRTKCQASISSAE